MPSVKVTGLRSTVIHRGTHNSSISREGAETQQRKPLLVKLNTELLSERYTVGCVSQHLKHISLGYLQMRAAPTQHAHSMTILRCCRNVTGACSVHRQVYVHCTMQHSCRPMLLVHTQSLGRPAFTTAQAAHHKGCCKVPGVQPPLHHCPTFQTAAHSHTSTTPQAAAPHNE